MTAPKPVSPTRQSLEEMAPDKRTARALELLFEEVSQLRQEVDDHETRITALEP